MSENEAKEPKPESYDRVIANWTRILGASTIALFIATGVSAYFLYKTDHTIETQVETTRLQMRAYVGMARITPKPFFEKPKDQTVSSVDVKYDWRNFGFTPAFDFEYFVAWGWYENNSEPDFSKPTENDTRTSLDLLGAQLETSTTLNVGRSDLMKSAAGNGRIFLWGVAKYRDFMSTPRTFAFCKIAKLQTTRDDGFSIYDYKKECNHGS